MAVAYDPLAPVTAEYLITLSRANPLVRFERSARGELIVSPPAGTIAGFGETELTRQVAQWSRTSGLGLAFGASVGFTLPDGAIYAPDAAWIATARWDALDPASRRGFARICPDAVFELRSESDGVNELRRKLQQYLENGARLGVSIDPFTMQVELSTERGKPEALPAGLHDLSGTMPGFVLDAAAICKLALEGRARS